MASADKLVNVVAAISGAPANASIQDKVNYAVRHPLDECVCLRTDKYGIVDQTGAVPMQERCLQCFGLALGVLEAEDPAHQDDILKSTAEALQLDNMDEAIKAFKLLLVTIPAPASTSTPASGKKGGHRTRGKKGKRSGSRKKRATRGKKRAGKKRSGSKRSGSKRSGSKRSGSKRTRRR